MPRAREASRVPYSAPVGWIIAIAAE